MLMKVVFSVAGFVFMALPTMNPIAQAQPLCTNVNGKMMCLKNSISPIMPIRPVIPAGTIMPQNRPYPPGTPCGPSVINGQNVFVNPQNIPGSYCDRDGTLQYQ
jgi:hypothetical protein